MSWWGLAYLDVLCVFVLGETHVWGQKIVKGFIYIGNVRAQPLNGTAKCPQKGTKIGQDLALAMTIDEPKNGQLVDQRAVGEVSSMDTYTGHLLI